MDSEVRVGAWARRAFVADSSRYSVRTSSGSPGRGRMMRCSRDFARVSVLISSRVTCAVISLPASAVRAGGTLLGIAGRERRAGFQMRAQHVVEGAQRAADGHMHVEILVRAQTPAENH